MKDGWMDEFMSMYAIADYTKNNRETIVRSKWGREHHLLLSTVDRKSRDDV